MPASTIFCNRCGLESASDARFCQRCGAALEILPAPAPTFPAPTLLDHYGGFWVRAVAALLDFLVLLAALIPMRMLFGSAVTVITLDGQLPPHEGSLIRRWVRIVVGLALAWAYRAGMESSAYQATLGKLAMRLKVTDLEGHRISVARATARWFLKHFSLLALGLGYLMVAFDEQKQGLHDRIAGTLVVYQRESDKLQITQTG